MDMWLRGAGTGVRTMAWLVLVLSWLRHSAALIVYQRWHVRSELNGQLASGSTLLILGGVSRLNCGRISLQKSVPSFSYLASNHTCTVLSSLPVYHTQTSAVPGTKTYQVYADSCPKSLGYSLLGEDFCVRVSSTSLAWHQASRVCESEGGHLVIVRTQQQRDALTTWLVDLGAVNQDSFQAGLSDIKQEGDFRWLDGEVLQSDFFDGGQPNGGTTQNCGVFVYLKSSTIVVHDRDCSVSYPYICQIPLTPWNS